MGIFPSSTPTSGIAQLTPQTSGLCPPKSLLLGPVHVLIGGSRDGRWLTLYNVAYVGPMPPVFCVATG